MLVSEVLQRAESEFLRAGSGVNLPSYEIQSGAMTIDGLTLSLEGTRGITVSRDSVVEWDDESMELALNKTTAGNVLTLQQRGYLETDPAIHAAGTRVLIDNPFPKKVLFNALKSVIRVLYGFGVYRRQYAPALTYQTTTPVALPADAEDTQSHIWVARGANLGYLKLTRGTHFDVIPLAAGPSVQFYTGGSIGQALVLPYKSEYDAPTAVSDNLTTLGLSESLQDALPMAVAARILMGRDVPKAHADHIRKQLEAQAVPLGSVSSIGQQLWRTFVTQDLAAEKVRLSEQNPPTIVYSG